VTDFLNMQNVTMKHSANFASACLFGVTVETNGYHGGDAGHGGFASVTFKDLSCTSWNVQVDGKQALQPTEATITVEGDCEMANLRDALLFAAAALNDLLNRKPR